MKLRKAATLIILGILHILILLPKVLCSGVFELRLTSFTNERGLDIDGNCCNGIKETVNGVSVCSEPCHTFYTVCLTNYMVNIPPILNKEKCVFGYVMTNVLGGNNVNFETLEGFNNLFTFHFNISWPGTFSIVIEAWHDITLSTPVKGSPRERISRLAVQRHLQVGPEWSNFIHKTAQTELEYKYRVQCSPDYYDAGCSSLCRPRDDHFGHYTCAEDGSKVCMSGWKGAYCDQAICLDGCAEQHGYCDQPYECKCRSGWEGSFCQECIKYPGCKNGNCSKPWECNCFEGWGGLFCTLDLNYCTHHTPCQHGGVCQNTGSGSFTCLCPEGYSGTTCEREIDDCLNQPCLNGGTCEDIGTGYSCRCPIGFTGKRCDFAAESCEKNPCKNGATCIEGQGSYVCQCKIGFTGRNCDQEIYECEPNPCQNNGRCIDEVNGFKCVCESGFSGKYCETNVDDCTHNPCKNNGVCIDKINDFECRCIAGFLGDFCQTNVDDCEMRPCANGGSCKDLVNDFKCTCRPGFLGRFCEIDVNECASSPCRNGATCRESVDNYHCTCPPGFTGKNCQYLPGQLETTPVTTEQSQPVHTGSTPVTHVTGRNVTITEQHKQGEEEFTTTQLLLIVCLGVGIPLLSIIVVVTILLCRKRRSPHTSKEEEENVQNSINNKLRESKIFTTIPQSSSNISNLTSKISNEDIDFNTLKSYRNSRPNSIYIGEKPINNKQLFYSTDLQVHSKHRDYDKSTKSLEKEKVSIDPSNLDVRDYRGSRDIHYIDKHINRDTINRNSLLILEPQIHQESHRHSSYYGDDVLATEV